MPPICPPTNNFPRRRLRLARHNVMTGRSYCRFLLLAALAAAGCGSPDAKFLRYEAFAHKVALDRQIKFSAEQRENIDEVLQALFGTPDEPRVPALEDVPITDVLDPAKLKLAAGPVGSDESGNVRGLYREHCAHCHGISGDGAGPTAVFLNPYPRDYRKGWFKFKSTPVGIRPTHEDLKKIVIEGIPGTAMPSFKLLPDLEVEALVHYVKYLSVRGETERALLLASSELNEDQVLLPVVAENATAEQKAFQQDQKAVVNDAVSQVVGNWTRAAEVMADPIAEVAARPEMSQEELVESRKRGQNLFYGFAQCIKCHGESALGDGQTTDYDEWTKEFIGDGKNTELVDSFVDSHLILPPRNIKPRNLRLGVYRGGRRPLDLYWRIKNGIEGVPMPAATMRPADDPNAKGLTPGDIWDLVNYVQSLPYESINNPLDAAHNAENPRERL
jgi:mono/diheme cytochrome c family protein